jgi:hypothetical protein
VRDGFFVVIDNPNGDSRGRHQSRFELRGSRGGEHLEVLDELVALSADERLGLSGPILLGQVAGCLGAVREIVEGEAAVRADSHGVAGAGSRDGNLHAGDTFAGFRVDDAAF